MFAVNRNNFAKAPVDKSVNIFSADDEAFFVRKGHAFVAFQGRNGRTQTNCADNGVQEHIKIRLIYHIFEAFLTRIYFYGRGNFRKPLCGRLRISNTYRNGPEFAHKLH